MGSMGPGQSFHVAFAGRRAMLLGSLATCGALLVLGCSPPEGKTPGPVSPIAAVASTAQVVTPAPRVCRAPKPESATAFSFEFESKKRSIEVDTKVIVSRNGAVVQELEGTEDPLVELAHVVDYKFARMDVDCDGSDDLVWFSHRSTKEEPGVVLVWTFDEAANRFAATPLPYAVRASAVDPDPGGGPRYTVRLLAGFVAGSDGAKETGERPVMLLRKGDLADFVANREGVSLPEAERQRMRGDVSFDGINDLFLPRGGSFDFHYAFWIFDPATGRLAHQPELSALTDPIFFADTKEVFESYRHKKSGRDHVVGWYRFVDGSLQKVYESEDTEAPPVPAFPKETPYRRVVRELRGGAMVVTCEAVALWPSGRLHTVTIGDKASCEERFPDVELQLPLQALPGRDP